MAQQAASKHCVAMVGHVLNRPIVDAFDRLRREAPVDHDVRFMLSSDQAAPDLAGLDRSRVVQIPLADILSPAYPRKCDTTAWEMAGNLDLVFLAFVRRHPGYDRYWFVEYDVHWQGDWRVLFEHFRGSDADVLATTMQRVSDVPQKLRLLSYPPLHMPEALGWSRERMVKGFLPICRLSADVLARLDQAYRDGLGGHYEITVPSIAAQAGLPIEDIGGDGVFVRPENRNRFYFARGATYSHSPGSFVFRPPPRVLPRPNTLWHPVKPGEVPQWHPLRVRGGLLKSVAERAKPLIWRAAIRVWFATRWRPLRPERQSGLS